MKELSIEDKKLLLKDLCARLPYGVLCEDMEGKTRPLFGITPTQHFIVTLDNATDGTNGLKFCTIDCVKPYLRPMSSMTKEEKEEYHKLCDYYYGIYFDTVESIDYLNKKMFDCRKDDEGKRMIEKGLALKAPKDMYK